MPIEIKELVIKASVKSTTDAKNHLLNKEKREVANELIVQEAIDQVAQMLKKKNER